MQRGLGLASIFCGLFRSVFLIIKKYALAIGRKALHTGFKITNDVADEQSFKDAAKIRIFGAFEESINKLVPQTGGMSGSGNQKKQFHRHLPRRSHSKKKRKLDIFS